MSKSYRMLHIQKGNIGELAVKDSLVNKGFTVKDHKVTEPGVDVEAHNGVRLIVAECLNWYGGYIHSKRFLSILNNLIAHSKAERYLICAGVRPTKDQFRILEASNIKIVCLPRQKYAVAWKDLLVNGLGLGVITSISKRGYHTSGRYLIDFLSCRKVYPEGLFNSRYKSWIIEAAFTVKKKGHSLDSSIPIEEQIRRREVRRLIKLHKLKVKREKEKLRST